ncbi:unnamed protein product, partial [Symbiodinium microadriaticum]
DWCDEVGNRRRVRLLAVNSLQGFADVGLEAGKPIDKVKSTSRAWSEDLQEVETTRYQSALQRLGIATLSEVTSCEESFYKALRMELTFRLMSKLCFRSWQVSTTKVDCID